MKWLVITSFVSCVALAGCNSPSASNKSSGSGGAGASAGGAPPVFSLAWSEYPSWSVFGVAHKEGLLDKSEGGMGSIEKKWNVDIVLNQAEYDPCLTQYGANQADAVCITNMDILAPSLKRASVAILPTSTSVGADACIAVGISDIDGLKGHTTWGLEKSVSQYAFERVLELNGKNPKDFTFKNQDPGVAATGMQASQPEFTSIMVWNPFVMQTLRTRKEAKVLFDSAKIPEEIIDMVVVGKESLNKPGGKRFAFAILDAYYAVNKMIADEKTRDKTLVGLEDMKTVVQQTKFYDTPEKALALFEGDTFRSKTMPMVADFCVKHEMCESLPSFGFGEDGKQLNFDLQFLTGVKEGITPDQVK
jgi:ABC-type nitrate/sulfonate/bicarbonate transport system substrate-binding protein